MRINKCFAFLLILICIFVLCTSCAESDNDLESIFEQITLNDGDENNEPFAEHIYIVIPRFASGELSLKAKELCEIIANKTGIITTVKYDSEFSSAPAKSCEILIGATDRLASDNAMSVLKDGDYLCRWDNGAIVICGRNDASTVIAIDRFIEEILHGASSHSIMMPNAHFENIEKYNISKIVLNGYDLYDYTIVYPDKNTSLEKEIAFTLRDLINRESGYLLKTVSESVFSKETGKAIKLVTSDGPSAIETKGGNIIISGDDSYSLSLAAERLVSEMYSANTDETVAVDYMERETFKSEADYFSLGIYYLDNEKGGVTYPMIDLVQKLKTIEEDLLLVFNSTESIIERIELGMLSNYRMETVEFAQGKAVIIYNSETVASVKLETDNEKTLIISAENKAGETVDLCYALGLTKEELRSLNGENKLVFADNCDAEDLQNTSLKNNAVIDGREVSYALVIGEKYTDENATKVTQTDTAFYCSSKIRFKVHPDFYRLKNTLE